MPPLVFPQSSTKAALDLIVAQALTLRLYSNSKMPQPPDTLASYVEVAGGGYAAVALNPASWTTTEGQPSVALYNAVIEFIFTGPTVAPTTVVGYYITTPDDVVLLAESFDAALTPFVPFAGGRIQIRPRFGSDNLIAPPVVIT